MEQALIVHQIKNKLLQSCSYIVESDFLILVDPGESSPLIDFVIESKKIVKAILLTHCHADHIYGLGEILNEIPNIQIYCSQITSDGLFDPKLNLSFLFPDCHLDIPHSSKINVISEGEFMISGLKIRAFETPGHSDDCLSFFIGEHAFTGDSYIPYSKVFTKWPRSQKDLAIKNETKLIEIIKHNNSDVHPGHWI